MSYELSSGALKTIMNGVNYPDPVVQILGSKKMTGHTSERFRLLVSDGCYVNSFAMLATQLNDKILSGELSDLTVIRINRLITSMVSNSGKGDKRVMIILDVTVLAPGSKVGIRIGKPVPYDEPPLVGQEKIKVLPCPCKMPGYKQGAKKSKEKIQDSLSVMDSCDIYGKYMASEIRQLNVQQRQIAKLKFQKILFDIQNPLQTIADNVTRDKTPPSRTDDRWDLMTMYS